MTDEENITNMFKAVLVGGEQKKEEVGSTQASAATSPFTTSEKDDATATVPVTPGAETDPTATTK